MDAVFWSGFDAYVYSFYVFVIFGILSFWQKYFWFEFTYYVFISYHIFVGSIHLFKCLKFRTRRFIRTDRKKRVTTLFNFKTYTLTSKMQLLYQHHFVFQVTLFHFDTNMKALNQSF